MNQVMGRYGGVKESPIDICRITRVDVENKLVSAYFFSNNRTIENVQFTFPSYYNGSGIMFIPEVGSIGISVKDETGLPVIIAFTEPINTNHDGTLSRGVVGNSQGIPDILEGDILIKSSGGCFTRFDSLGNLTLSSPVYSYLKLNSDGSLELDCENMNSTFNGKHTETYMDNYSPILEIEAGKQEAVIIGENSVQLCYKVSIIKEGNKSHVLKIDKDGNIYLDAPNIFINGNLVVNGKNMGGV